MAEFKHHPQCKHGGAPVAFLFCDGDPNPCRECELFDGGHQAGRAEREREIVADLRSDQGEPQYFRDILANLADRYERGEYLPAKAEGGSEMEGFKTTVNKMCAHSAYKETCHVCARQEGIAEGERRERERVLKWLADEAAEEINNVQACRALERAHDAITDGDHIASAEGQKP